MSFPSEPPSGNPPQGVPGQPPPGQPGYGQQPPPGYVPTGYVQPGQQVPKKVNWVFCLLGAMGCGFFGILIMAALLFPVFAKARESARQASCASNEKQIELAIIEYQQDYSGSMPPADGWTTRISKYLPGGSTTTGGMGSTLHCPDAANSVSYGVNQSTANTNQANISDPTVLVTVYESDSQDPNPSGGVTDANLTRHSSGSNLGFYDGHVKWQTPDEARGIGSTITWTAPPPTK